VIEGIVGLMNFRRVGLMISRIDELLNNRVRKNYGF